MSEKRIQVGTRFTKDVITDTEATVAQSAMQEKPIYKTIYICDWCGRESDRGFLDGSITNNENFEFTFYVTSGEGTHMCAEGWEIDDLCRDCIKRLRKLLIDQGITLKKVDW